MWVVKTWGSILKSNEAKHPANPSRLERALQINVALLTALGAVLLGTGQMGTHSLLLALLAVFAAVTSAIFTDFLAWFRLNRTLANLAAILAVGFSLTDFFGNDAEYQLLAVANLLIYLQVVLLFQEKNERIYWQLMILSLLQVVVSAALNLGLQFGILVVTYMFTAFSAMGLFFFSRESSRFVAGSAELGKKGAARRAAAGGGPRARRRRWPLRPSGRSLAFRFKGNLADVFVPRRLAGQVLSMGLSTLVFTVAFFFALPRAGDSVWQGPRGLARSVVGFSQEIELDTMSKMLQSEEEVLRVTYVDERTREPVQLRTGAYIRGTVLVNYLYGKGRWRQLYPTDRRRGETLARPRTWDGVLRQEFVLQRQPDPILFATFPVYDVPGTRIQVKIDPETRQLLRDDFERTSGVTYPYVLGTTAFHDLEHLPVHPAGRDFLVHEVDRMRRCRKDLLPRLSRIAAEVVATAGVADDDLYGKALALEAHFHEPGRYEYSLNQLGIERQRHLDPVEDFVANHRTGHCEYFASALVLMLRSQDVPARVVVGYRAANFNSLGEFYQVREKDAHAWAEVLLPYDQVPAELRQTARIKPRGAWLRLEPTPVQAVFETDDEVVTLWDQALEWKNFTQGLWSDYVLGLNAERQRAAIYGPIVRYLKRAVQAIRDPATWRRLAEYTWAAGWIILLICVGLALVLGARFVWRRKVRSRRAGRRPESVTRRLVAWFRSRRRAAAARRRVRVDFYERLETLLARYGMRRRRYQTQREFAAAVSRRLVDTRADRRAAPLPPQIVDVFYGVRFGGRALSKEDTRSVDEALDTLRDALQAGSSKPSESS
jgi:transglutaminase-like putative cysteine protease